MRIFISYAHNDQLFVEQLAARLADYHEVWFDRRLHGGDQWWQSILKQLRWCDCFIYVLTPESLASTYCQREYTVARRRGKKIVPVRLAPVEELPQPLGRVHYIDFAERNFYDALAELIGDLSKLERKPSPRTLFLRTVAGIIVAVLAVLGIFLPIRGPAPSQPSPTNVLIATAQEEVAERPSITPMQTEAATAGVTAFSPVPASSTATWTPTLPPPLSTNTLPPPPTATTIPPTDTWTSTVTPIPTAAPTATPTLTATTTATATALPPPSPTRTLAPTVTASLTPSCTPTEHPSGRWIAFESNRDGNREIYIMNLDGSGPINLTNNPASDRFPAWSPDGTRIAFRSDRDGNNEIYVMVIPGGSGTASSELVNLTNHPADDFLPAWSPDGTRIAFASDRDDPDHENCDPNCNSEIYVMNADGTRQTQLTDNSAWDAHPAWSPDGTQIAFHSNRDGNYEIYVMNVDGSELTNLTRHAAWDYNPAWSPDGTQIAFASTRNRNVEIFIMAAPGWAGADGSEPIQLTSNLSGDWNPTWSPDGTRIIFESYRDGNYEIYAMNADGSGPTNLTHHPADDVFPSWQP